MSREILFRGMLVGGGGWVYGDLLECKDKKTYPGIENDMYSNTYISEKIDSFDVDYVVDQSTECLDLKARRVIPETVGQYINRLDLNNAKAFEGDKYKRQVLLSPDGISSAHNITYWVDVECEIVMNKGQYVGAWKVDMHKSGDHIISDRSGYTAIPTDFETIGNIHEEPTK